MIIQLQLCFTQAQKLHSRQMVRTWESSTITPHFFFKSWSASFPYTSHISRCLGPIYLFIYLVLEWPWATAILEPVWWCDVMADGISLLFPAQPRHYCIPSCQPISAQRPQLEITGGSLNNISSQTLHYISYQTFTVFFIVKGGDSKLLKKENPQFKFLILIL